MNYIFKLSIALISTITILSATKEESVESKSIKIVDFSMVISGGVSLGAYEAGYNWAIIKMLSEIKTKYPHLDPRLKSVSGASAGSINGLLSAMYWCQKESIPYENSVDDNLFFETWANLGIEDLIIKGKDPKNKSTLFTRKELRKKADRIMKHLSKPIYKEGCEVPMGFAVTKVTPIEEQFQGITIKNQTFSIPFTFKVINGKVKIVNREMPPSDSFYLSIPGIEKDYKKIIDVLFASSAFPGAFEQVKLRYKYKGKVESHYFIDGGAFNNVPLDLATELNDEAKIFIFMNPTNMRKESKEKNVEEEKPPVGFLTSSASPLKSSIEIYQQMQLYNAINKYFRHNPERRLILSSRYHPLTARYLEHFAAFLDRNFRLYDYYVGVYDAIYHLSKALKDKNEFKDLSHIELMNKFMKHLGIDKNRDAYTAYKFFRDTEFGAKNIDKNSRYAAIYYAFNRKLPDSQRYTASEFKKFLSKLDMRYLPVKKGSFLAEARRDIKHWGKKPIKMIVNRITTLENERAEVYPGYKPTAKAVSIAAWAGSSLLNEKEGWSLFPLNAPIDKGNESLHTALRFLPSEISADSSNGGLSFAYSSYWYGDMEYLSGFEFKPSFTFNEKSNFLRMDINTFYIYDDFVKLGVGVSGFGNLEKPFFERDSAYGANIYVDFMDIFRATYVRRHGDNVDNGYLYLGVENIPSLLYWLNR
ncbi:hypothetical protein MNB_SV-6-1273 [hydrothermal vent metagenome]|uniref:PNPLA domain-containing protein n=1 Tax=hydrothermal vent metagenome TaxID=652676 RepID=A0A1W1BE14_9ZZZZ